MLFSLSSSAPEETPARGTLGLCRSLVLYEDAPTRERVEGVCADLTARFTQDIQFQFEWCGLKYLKVPEVAREIGETVRTSDLIIFSLRSLGFLPLECISWLELWLSQRTTTEGALVIFQSARELTRPIPWQEPYLRALAQRANLDYLPSPVSTEGPWERLDENAIIPDPSAVIPPSTHHHSSGWGINE